MPNEFIVFSETRQNWITPKYQPIAVLSGRLRRKEGDEALIEIGTGWLKQGKRLIPHWHIPRQCRRVRVEKSIGGNRKTFWWLVDMEAS